MDKYSSVKSGKEPDLSDYKEYKLKEDNIGIVLYNICTFLVSIIAIS